LFGRNLATDSTYPLRLGDLALLLDLEFAPHR